MVVDDGPRSGRVVVSRVARGCCCARLVRAGARSRCVALGRGITQRALAADTWPRMAGDYAAGGAVCGCGWVRPASLPEEKGCVRVWLWHGRMHGRRRRLWLFGRRTAGIFFRAGSSSLPFFFFLPQGASPGRPIIGGPGYGVAHKQKVIEMNGEKDKTKTNT